MRSIEQQRGITLATGLILLLMVTLLGITAMSTSSFQQKMTANFVDKEVAFQAAESGLIAGESWLNSQILAPIAVSGCTPPCVLAHDPDFYMEDQTATWWSTNGALASEVILPTVSTQPRYTIQYVTFIPDDLVIGSGDPPGRYYYYVTSRGTGASDDAEVLVESSFARRF